ncbi:hypothetical protein [Amycolatopsis suaedae]|uniref:hypothetical protein n=1 Tax=Amycolatopsis suaedae TaxID=2510978 RepID=UPI0013EF3A4B|nr:hypothetical protein [Amycolatopsis suaedae]
MPHHRYSCYASWQRLPGELKRAITANRGRDLLAHAEAMHAARRWFDDNPRRPR